jgi:hypothetical protein
MLVQLRFVVREEREGGISTFVVDREKCEAVRRERDIDGILKIVM